MMPVPDTAIHQSRLHEIFAYIELSLRPGDSKGSTDSLNNLASQESLREHLLSAPRNPPFALGSDASAHETLSAPPLRLSSAPHSIR